MSERIPLFTIWQEQKDRLTAWCEKHRTEAHPNGVREMTGAWLKYTILPSGMGDTIEVECIWCPGVKVNLTLDDDGEFMYDLEGRKTWCSSYANPDWKFGQSHCGNPQLHIERCTATGKHLTQVDRDGDCKFCDHH
jgi:hypothetical protein